MTVFRFMSNDEFQKYKSGKVMKSKKDHAKVYHKRTNSKGFCFFNIEDFTPEEALHFLSGIVSFDVCAVFETEEKLTKTYGVYAKPIENDGDMLKLYINLLFGWEESFTADEYCINQYDKRSFKLVKYSRDIWKQYNLAEEQTELDWEVCNEIQITNRNKKENGKRDKAIRT